MLDGRHRRTACGPPTWAALRAVGCRRKPMSAAAGRRVWPARRAFTPFGLQRPASPSLGGRAQSAATTRAGSLRTGLRPVLHSGLCPHRWTRWPASLRDALPRCGSARVVAALRGRPGLRPPTSYRPAGAGLRCRDAMPCGHPLRGGYAVAARRHGRGSPQRPAEGRAGLRPPGLAPASRLPTIQPRRIQPERGRSSS